jgi:hypothetical protein
VTTGPSFGAALCLLIFHIPFCIGQVSVRRRPTLKPWNGPECGVLGSKGRM